MVLLVLVVILMVEVLMEMIKICQPVAKSIKPNLYKCKILDFAKTDSSRTDVLTLKAKKAFIQLQNSYTEVLILCHFNAKPYVNIETDAFTYIIGVVLG